MAEFIEAPRQKADYPHIEMEIPPSRAIVRGENGERKEGVVKGASTYIPLPEVFLRLGANASDPQQFSEQLKDCQYFVDYLARCQSRGFKFIKFGNVSGTNRFVAALKKKMEWKEAEASEPVGTKKKSA